MEKAVLDRIEEGQAVLLVGDDERELLVLRSALPAEAKPGTWLYVDVVDGALRDVRIDHANTSARKASIDNKMRRLLDRGRADRPT